MMMLTLSVLIFSIIVVCSSLLLIHVGVTAAPSPTKPYVIQPPLLPYHYISQFVEWTATNTTPPPFVDGKPHSPSPSAVNASYFTTLGKTYYDWQTPGHPSMIEERYGNCINIFPGFSNKGWSCTFFNVQGKTFLTSNNSKHLPPCCVFGDPWHPPAPDFLRVDVTAIIASESLAWNDRPPTNFATWFIVPDVPPPAGPFYYAYTQARHEPSVVLQLVEIFDSFSFPGIEGWAVQNFYNQRFDKPPADVWRLPSECRTDNVPNCGFFGVNEKMYHARNLKKQNR